jgi:hypothetical protein
MRGERSNDAFGFLHSRSGRDGRKEKACHDRIGHAVSLSVFTFAVNTGIATTRSADIIQNE